MAQPSTMPAAPAMRAATASSAAISASTSARGTPSARRVRSTPRRCSNARPTADWVMNSPTMKLRSAKAVRFRWKLSVSAAGSAADPACGSLRVRCGAIRSSGGAPGGCAVAATSAVRFSPIPKSPCAMPTSTISVFGGASASMTMASPRRSAPSSARAVAAVA